MLPTLLVAFVTAPLPAVRPRPLQRLQMPCLRCNNAC
eukprot:SAG25_NODE_9814_length_357_cov_0.600775_1_plen_36_part_10